MASALWPAEPATMCRGQKAAGMQPATKIAPPPQLAGAAPLSSRRAWNPAAVIFRSIKVPAAGPEAPQPPSPPEPTARCAPLPASPCCCSAAAPQRRRGEMASLTTCPPLLPGRGGGRGPPPPAAAAASCAASCATRAPGAFASCACAMQCSQNAWVPQHTHARLLNSPQAMLHWLRPRRARQYHAHPAPQPPRCAAALRLRPPRPPLRPHPASAPHAPCWPPRQSGASRGMWTTVRPARPLCPPALWAPRPPPSPTGAGSGAGGALVPAMALPYEGGAQVPLHEVGTTCFDTHTAGRFPLHRCLKPCPNAGDIATQAWCAAAATLAGGSTCRPVGAAPRPAPALPDRRPAARPPSCLTHSPTPAPPPCLPHSPPRPGVRRRAPTASPSATTSAPPPRKVSGLGVRGRAEPRHMPAPPCGGWGGAPREGGARLPAMPSSAA